MTKNQKRSWRRRIAFSCVILVFFLLTLELLFRVFWERPPTTVGQPFILNSIFVDDADCGWRMKPGVELVHRLFGGVSYTIRTNARGYRGPEHALPPSTEAAAPRQRVVVLGDSFAFGWGVEEDETFAARLEAGIANTDVINLGVSGYNVVQSHRLLVAEGLRYRPDVVIFAFCQNDVMEQTFRTMAGMQANARSTEHPPMSLKRRVVEASYLVGFLQHSASTVRPVRRLLQKLRLKEADAGYEKLDSNVRPNLRVYPDSLAQAWASTVAELRAMHATCRAHGAVLLVAAIPPRQAMVPGELQRTLAYLAYEPADFDMRKCIGALAQVCEADGIAFVDFSAALEAPDDRYFLYFDMHINAAGHRQLAAALQPVVIQLLQ